MINRKAMEESNVVKRQMLAGEWYDAADKSLIAELRRCQQECFEINQMPPTQLEERNCRVATLLGKAGQGLHVNMPFWCDYGSNIEVGDFFFANYNLVILDEARVAFGHHVYIGPNCSFYTAIHPLDAMRRNADIERALPIVVGDSVWIGGNVTVLPGVTIGDCTVIGAGSVITHDIPDHVVAVGNPCHVIRRIEDDCEKD